MGIFKRKAANTWSDIDGLTFEHGPGSILRARTPKSTGKKMAAAYIKWDKGDGEIQNIYVHEDHRRKGLATELLRRAREINPDVHHSELLSKDGKAWSDKAASLQTTAVDTSGVIRRCPFCGSGQVLQRSDGTTHCDFCDTAFTVTMMPNMPAMPTYVNGQDAPNENNMGPEEIGAEQMDPMDPTAMGPATGDAFVPPEGSQEGGPGVGAPGGAPGAGGQPFVPPEGSQDGQPGLQQAAASLRTASGDMLGADDYLRHLAIAAAPPERRTLVIAAVRDSRVAIQLNDDQKTYSPDKNDRYGRCPHCGDIVFGRKSQAQEGAGGDGNTRGIFRHLDSGSQRCPDWDKDGDRNQVSSSAGHTLHSTPEKVHPKSHPTFQRQPWYQGGS